MLRGVERVEEYKLRNHNTDRHVSLCLRNFVVQTQGIWTLVTMV